MSSPYISTGVMLLSILAIGQPGHPGAHSTPVKIIAYLLSF